MRVRIRGQPLFLPDLFNFLNFLFFSLRNGGKATKYIMTAEGAASARFGRPFCKKEFKTMDLTVNLGMLKSLSRAKTYLAGETIVCDGLDKTMFVIIKGEVRAVPCARQKGAEKAVTLGPGEFFGASILFLKEKPRYAYLAQTELIVLQVNRCSFGGFLRDEPEMAFEIMRVFCARCKSDGWAFV